MTALNWRGCLYLWVWSMWWWKQPRCLYHYTWYGRGTIFCYMTRQKQYSWDAWQHSWVQGLVKTPGGQIRSKPCCIISICQEPQKRCLCVCVCVCVLAVYNKNVLASNYLTGVCLISLSLSLSLSPHSKLWQSPTRWLPHSDSGTIRPRCTRQHRDQSGCSRHLHMQRPEPDPEWNEPAHLRPNERDWRCVVSWGATHLRWTRYKTS